jgi:hypothetical protein
MKKPAAAILRLLCGAVALSSTGCLTKRTVSEGGQVVSENFYVKRPVRDAMNSGDQSGSR